MQSTLGNTAIGFNNFVFQFDHINISNAGWHSFKYPGTAQTDDQHVLQLRSGQYSKRCHPGFYVQLRYRTDTINRRFRQAVGANCDLIALSERQYGSTATYVVIEHFTLPIYA